MLRINDVAPNFEAETTHGPVRFHEWLGDSWGVLFSHPKDFTPVCTTELGYMAGLQSEFDKRNCKIIGLSADPVTDHGKWAADIERTQGHKVSYPMIGDFDLKVAKLYGMLPAEAGDTCAGRTAANNATVRTVFMIGPDKKIKLMLIYPMNRQSRSIRRAGSPSCPICGLWRSRSRRRADSGEKAWNWYKLSDSIWVAWPTPPTWLDRRASQPLSIPSAMSISTLRRQPAMGGRSNTLSRPTSMPTSSQDIVNLRSAPERTSTSAWDPEPSSFTSR